MRMYVLSNAGCSFALVQLPSGKCAPCRHRGCRRSPSHEECAGLEGCLWRGPGRAALEMTDTTYAAVCIP